MQIIVMQPLPRIDPPETEKFNPTLLIMTDAVVYTVQLVNSLFRVSSPGMGRYTQCITISTIN